MVCAGETHNPGMTMTIKNYSELKWQQNLDVLQYLPPTISRQLKVRRVLQVSSTSWLENKSQEDRSKRKSEKKKMQGGVLDYQEE